MMVDEQDPRVTAAQAVPSAAATTAQSPSTASKPRHSEGMHQGCPGSPASSCRRHG